MRLSRNAHYAIRIALDLARNERGRSLEIADRQGIPRAYIARVIQGLSKAGLLRTHRGTRGGVQLAREPRSITLLDILAATEGPLALNLCVVWDDCRCVQPCPVRASLARLQSVVERELGAVTIAQLAQRLPASRPRAEAMASFRSQ